MEYKTFIKQVPKETNKMIKKAIDIYSLVYNKNIDRIIYDRHGKTTFPLGKIDKKCLSLFLAGILTNDFIDELMFEHNITAEEIMKYLNIEQTKIKGKTEKEYEIYFEKEFKIILELMERNMSSVFDKNEVEYMYPEYVMNCLAYTHICISDIIEQLYISLGNIEIGDVLTKHETFRTLNEMFEKRIVAIIDQTLNDEIKEKSTEIKLKKIFDTEKEEQNILVNKTLTKYGNIMTNEKYNTNPAIGREKELKELMLTLLTPDKSAVITGEPGVGKTSVVEGLAYLVSQNQVPNMLKNIQIVKINTSALLSGCLYRGMFEERVEEILKEIEKETNTILFIDEMHTIIGAGSSSETDLDFANILKPYLDRGKIKMIGATTNEEYDRYIQKDEALKRRFEKIKVSEPTDNITVQILLGTIPKLEQITNIKFDYEEKEKRIIMELIVDITNKKCRTYNDNINNPDLSLTILKKAFAHAALLEHTTVEIEDIKEAIKSNERISSLVRIRKSKELSKIFEIKEEQKTAKIIEFPKK